MITVAIAKPTNPIMQHPARGSNEANLLPSTIFAIK
jgi:hypothetical protein